MAEITLNTQLGAGLYTFVKTTKLDNIVEIGGWDGRGSTLCMFKAIKELENKHINLYSIELQTDRHTQARQFYAEHINDGYRIILLNGIISDALSAEKYTGAHLNEFNSQQGKNFRAWYSDNIKKINDSRNVLDMLPKSIDLLVLDGGEYTTYSEWGLLKDKCHYIALDDTRKLKCKYIKQEILDMPHKIILDATDRNGGLIVEILKTS